MDMFCLDDELDRTTAVTETVKGSAVIIPIGMGVFLWGFDRWEQPFAYRSITASTHEYVRHLTNM